MLRSIASHSASARTLLVLVLFFGLVITARADWHTGTVTSVNVGYDGMTISFGLSGWSRSNCTCYPSWSTYMCLDRSRNTFKEEYAWLLSARATQQLVSVNIDEATCKVQAISAPQ
jgi:hypothetical protein